MQFAYGLKYRPASVGAVPQGRFTVKDALPGEGARCTRHGVIVYDRPLTESEIRSFELVVLADDQQIDELTNAVVQKLEGYAESYLDLSRDDPAMFTSVVAERLDAVRPYPVFVGSLDEFAQRVVGKLGSLFGNKNGGA